MIVLDRFEGNMVVLETDDKDIVVEKDLIPDDAKEGCVLIRKDDRYVTDQEETERRTKIINDKFDSLF